LYYVKNLAELNAWNKQFVRDIAIANQKAKEARGKMYESTHKHAEEWLLQRGSDEIDVWIVKANLNPEQTEKLREQTNAYKVKLKKKSKKQWTAEQKKFARTDARISEMQNAATTSFCKQWNIGKLGKFKWAAVTVETRVLPYGMVDGHAGGGAAAGLGAGATRLLPLHALPTEFVQNLDLWRCREDYTGQSCKKVHGGASNDDCKIPAKLKKLVAIVRDAIQVLDSSKFVVCCGYAASTENAVKALATIEGIKSSEIETVLADDDRQDPSRARAKKFAAFQSAGGKKILCMEFKGACFVLSSTAVYSLMVSNLSSRGFKPACTYALLQIPSVHYTLTS
jgi:hypothetical protein